MKVESPSSHCGRSSLLVNSRERTLEWRWWWCTECGAIYRLLYGERWVLPRKLARRLERKHGDKSGR